jgi:hypothetical protein
VPFYGDGRGDIRHDTLQQLSVESATILTGALFRALGTARVDELNRQAKNVLKFSSIGRLAAGQKNISFGPSFSTEGFHRTRGRII